MLFVQFVFGLNLSHGLRLYVKKNHAISKVLGDYSYFKVLTAYVAATRLIDEKSKEHDVCR